MPKLPRISGSEAIRILKRLGFEQVRQTGSHVVLRRDHKGCVLPLYKELKVGTLTAFTTLLRGKVLVYVLGGGNKSTQKKDIAKAKAVARTIEE